jgi:hypothetical protein
VNEKQEYLELSLTVSIDKCNCNPEITNDNFIYLCNDPDFDPEENECGQPTSHFYIRESNHVIGRCLAHTMREISTATSNLVEISREEALVWEVMNS